MLFSTPIRRKPATTAPLTTLTTISTESTRPMMPKVTTKGTIGARLVSSCCRTARYDSVPSMVPGGSELAIVRMSACSAAAEPAAANLYSNCDVDGVPGARKAEISAGRTQPSADWLTDVATPTRVSTGDPGTPRAVICEPTGMPRLESLDRTNSPGRLGQWPRMRVRSSRGPPGEGRPTSVTGGPLKPTPLPTLICGVTVTSPNGPDIALTDGNLRVAASCRGVARSAFTVTTRCGPRWAANAVSNGEAESTTRPRAKTQAAVETSTTRPMTIVVARRRATPPRAATVTAPSRELLIAVPRSTHHLRFCRRRAARSGWHSAPPGPGCG